MKRTAVSGQNFEFLAIIKAKNTDIIQSSSGDMGVPSSEPSSCLPDTERKVFEISIVVASTFLKRNVEKTGSVELEFLIVQRRDMKI